MNWDDQFDMAMFLLHVLNDELEIKIPEEKEGPFIDAVLSITDEFSTGASELN